MPLVDTQTIRDSLNDYLLDASRTEAEVHSQFPSDEDSVSEGIYVARIYESERTIDQLVYDDSGHIYKFTDDVEFYLIYGQDNPYLEDYLRCITELIDDEIFIGYDPREYEVDQVFQGNSERYRVTYHLTRW